MSQKDPALLLVQCGETNKLDSDNNDDSDNSDSPLSPRPYNSVECIEQANDSSARQFIAVRRAVCGDRIMRSCIFSSWDDAKMFVQGPDSQYHTYDDVESAVKYAFGIRSVDRNDEIGSGSCVDGQGGQQQSTDSSVEEMLPLTSKKPDPPEFSGIQKEKWQKEQSNTCREELESEEAQFEANGNEKKTQITRKIQGRTTKSTARVTHRKPKDTWEENYLKLRMHLKEYGSDAQVQKNPANALLVRWINQQKKEYRELQSTGKSKLAPSQIQRLNDIGFQFTSRRKYGSWSQRMKEFLEFKQLVGHGRVPVAHPTLGSWVHEQRRQHKLFLQNDPKTKLTAKRVSELQKAGFLFEVAKKTDPSDARGSAKTWDERYNELKQFKSMFGHTIVPQHYPQLGWWVNTQRKEHKKMITGKKNSLTAERIMKLTKIDFVFDASSKKGYSRNNTPLSAAIPAITTTPAAGLMAPATRNSAQVSNDPAPTANVPNPTSTEFVIETSNSEDVKIGGVNNFTEIEEAAELAAVVETTELAKVVEATETDLEIVQVTEVTEAL